MTCAPIRCWIAALPLLGCMRTGADGPSPMDDGPTKDTDTALDSTGEVLELPGDRCGDPIEASIGTFIVTLHDAASDLGGACGAGGPDVFARIAIPHRADLRVSARGNGFVPRVGVIGTCTEDWATHTLGCSDGLPITVFDLPAGGEVLLAIGAAADEPMIAGASSDEDALVEVQTSLRGVLPLGESCSDSGGRCQGGTICRADAEGFQRCVAADGDTCATADEIVLAVDEPQSVAIDPATAQTDAHLHSCVGARRPDRVLRLVLPESMPPASALSVTAQAEGIGLAARAPGCLAADEVACAVPSPGGTSIALDDVGAVLGPGRTVFVFVELPVADAVSMGDGSGEQAPFVVELLLSGSA